MQVSMRVSEERGSFIGEEVGYCVRFDDCFNPETTRIKVNITQFGNNNNYKNYGEGIIQSVLLKGNFKNYATDSTLIYASSLIIIIIIIFLLP